MVPQAPASSQHVLLLSMLPLGLVAALQLTFKIWDMYKAEPSPLQPVARRVFCYLIPTRTSVTSVNIHVMLHGACKYTY